MSVKEQAASALRRASDEWRFMHDLETERSNRIGIAQRCAEQSFRAILYYHNVKMEKTHDLDELAKKNAAQLQGVWPRLSPILDDYAKLFIWRNKFTYTHQDIPHVVNQPPLTDTIVDEAVTIAETLYKIATETVVR